MTKLVDDDGNFIDKGRSKPVANDKTVEAIVHTRSLRGLPYTIGGLVLLLVGGLVAFTASSLFVCIFFTGLMVMGSVFIAGGNVIGVIGRHL